MSKIADYLVIGDIHLHDKYPGYLDHQIETIEKIVHLDNYEHQELVLLGDVFHKRCPTPTELLAAQNLFAGFDKETHVLMGNHDAQFKSDDGTTALSLFETEYIRIYDKPWGSGTTQFIPHFEDESKIEEALAQYKKRKWVFGHFGYKGCLNSVGNYDFNIEPSLFKHPTILGHVHEYKRYAGEENITILGTPYQTDFNGQTAKRYVGMIYGDQLKTVENKRGPKFISCDFSDLEDRLKTVHAKDNYTIVRTYINKFAVDNVRDLRKEILDKYPKIKYLDIKFSGELDKYTPQSNYTVDASLASINDVIIKDYMNENATTIPEAELMEGLSLINEVESDRT